MSTAQKQTPDIIHPSAIWVVLGVLVWKLTPSLLEAQKTWEEKPELRTTLVIWYIVAAMAALIAYEKIAGG
jgi:hypothetical protein